MSYQDGWAALHKEMPPRVPHTEYSLQMHPDVIHHVTGWRPGPDTTPEQWQQAGIDIVRAFNYDLMWTILTERSIFGEKCTDMGHAVYQAGGTDYRTEGQPLYTRVEDALRFDPWELYGPKDQAALTRAYDAHFDGQNALYTDLVNMTGIYVTCMSGLIDIFGWDMLLTMAGEDPEGFGAVTDRYCGWIFQYFEALARCKSPVVMIHDDIVWTNGAFIRPAWYRKYIFPNYKKLLAPLHDAGKIIIFTSDGTYTEFIDDIAACGVHSFVMEPTTDMAYIAEKYGRTHGFIGNADTRVLMWGTQQDIETEVKRCMDIGKGCPGFFLAVGNHIPPNTPLNNVLFYHEIYEKLSRR